MVSLNLVNKASSWDEIFHFSGSSLFFLGSVFQLLCISLTNSNQTRIYVVLRILGTPFLDIRFLSYVSICNGGKTSNISFEIWELE